MKIIQFLKNWNELLTLPIALLLWWYSNSILRMIDETAGVYDVGIFQAFLLGTAGILFGHALVWLILKLSAGDVYRTLDDFLNRNTLITPWQRGLFSLLYFGFLLIAWSILVAGMS
ncbi:MAG: hypothetical protein KGZ82_04170 [Bacteroidales bacterium]|nr:hypothetical protein [Bacteroidales bacterium]